MRYAHTVGRALLCAVLCMAIVLIFAGCRRQAGQSSRGKSGAVEEICPPKAAAQPPAAPAWRPVAGCTVILDPGHGGKDEGASHFDLREKDICLDVAERTARQLRARGVKVVMTRTTDEFIPLPERSAIANRHPNSVFVSIHINAVDNKPQVAGIETFILAKEMTDEIRSRAAVGRYSVGGADAEQGRQTLENLMGRCRSRSSALAASLQRAMCGRLGEPDRGVKSANLAVLRETYFGPAALVELGFLTNAGTAQRMRGEDWRRRAAEAICEGVCDFLQKPE